MKRKLPKIGETQWFNKYLIMYEILDNTIWGGIVVFLGLWFVFSLTVMNSNKDNRNKNNGI